MQLPTLSLTQQRVLLMITLLVVIIVAIVLGAVLKSIGLKKADDEYKTLKNVVTEKFNTFTRHDKNGTYNTYLKSFYSSRDNSANYTIMFMPSVTDVACTNFSDDINEAVPCGSEEGAAPIGSVSIRDNRSAMGVRPYELCGSRSAAVGPLDPQDAHVRIFTNIYSLRKTCVQLPYTSLTQYTVPNSAVMLWMQLPVESQATLFFMLSRPVFLQTDASYIYHLKSRTINYRYGYDEPGSASVDVILDKVNDAMMYEVGTRNNKQDLESIYSDTKDGLMNATIYYLNYEHPVRRGLSDVTFDTINDHVLTVMIPITRQKLTQIGDWLNLSNPRLRIAYNNESQRVNVDMSGAVIPAMKIGNHGYYILIYATDTVTICYMSRGKVKLRSVPGAQNLNLSSADKDRIGTAIDSAGISPPTSCFPCTKFAIPNLYDVYTKLVGFG